MRRPHPSDLAEEQWAIIEPLIPVNRVGWPREVNMRNSYEGWRMIWRRAEGG